MPATHRHEPKSLSAPRRDESEREQPTMRIAAVVTAAARCCRVPTVAGAAWFELDVRDLGNDPDREVGHHTAHHVRTFARRLAVGRALIFRGAALVLRGGEHRNLGHAERERPSCALRRSCALLIAVKLLG